MIGKALKEKMYEKGMLSKNLAKAAGVTEATISRYINDQRQPNAEILLKISQALGCEPGELLGSKPKKCWQRVPGGVICPHCSDGLSKGAFPTIMGKPIFKYCPFCGKSVEQEWSEWHE